MDIYLILVLILFALAITDLVVGVSNDAVNFLNSAVGSKAASFRVILIIASLGVFAGAASSSGMMEIARKGIFHPDNFYFTELMFIFLSVMVTDVILLDIFNSMGLPTSTTVSIVFELLGAAVAIAIIKILQADEQTASDIGEYINSGKALLIIGGILLSVVVAFTMGAIIQYLSRILFSFNYEKNIKKYGCIWGGIAITSIVYFILLKGIKGSDFTNTYELNGVILKEWIKTHTIIIVGTNLIFWIVIMQILSWLKVNILKVITLVGTFALALAFAGNDLVNFIGVPIAGWNSYQIFTANPGADPNFIPMSALAGKVPTPLLFLLFAGFVMVITLWLSKKARRVLKTTLDLSNQTSEVNENFSASKTSRALVKWFLKANYVFNLFIPVKLKNRIKKQFDQTHYKGSEVNTSFDLVRASVNLSVASILISIATSFKLPLSTTYVTFMVAMGTSLADKAWGRESAVYRITGVLTVVSGWFMTAFIAFIVAGLFAAIIFYTKGIAFFALLLLAIYVIFITYKKSKKKIKEENTKEDNTCFDKAKIMSICNQEVAYMLEHSIDIYKNTISGFANKSEKKIKLARKELKCLIKQIKNQKKNIYKTIMLLQEDYIETGHKYVQVIDYLREITRSLNYMMEQCYEHVKNQHNWFKDEQNKELITIQNEISNWLKLIHKDILAKDFDNFKKVREELLDYVVEIRELKKKQVKRIKNHEDSTKNSLLYLNLMTETTNLIYDVIHVAKAQKIFETKGKNYEDEYII